MKKRQNKKYKKQRDLFLKTIKHECHYCGVKTISRANQVNSTTIDHIKPQSTHPHLIADQTNFVLACGSCNSFRGTMEYNKFKQLISK